MQLQLSLSLWNEKDEAKSGCDAVKNLSGREKATLDIMRPSESSIKSVGSLEDLTLSNLLSFRGILLQSHIIMVRMILRLKLSGMLQCSMSSCVLSLS